MSETMTTLRHLWRIARVIAPGACAGLLLVMAFWHLDLFAWVGFWGVVVLTSLLRIENRLNEIRERLR